MIFSPKYDFLKNTCQIKLLHLHTKVLTRNLIKLFLKSRNKAGKLQAALCNKRLKTIIKQKRNGYLYNSLAWMKAFLVIFLLL